MFIFFCVAYYATMFHNVILPLYYPIGAPSIEFLFAFKVSKVDIFSIPRDNRCADAYYLAGLGIRSYLLSVGGVLSFIKL